MERVIQNLMDNAIKYTPEKGWINLEVGRKDGAIKVNIQNSGEFITKDSTVNFPFDPRTCADNLKENKKHHNKKKKLQEL
jgi:K+-sensing histidine kinase KdpD